jgi:hypothetical protein
MIYLALNLLYFRPSQICCENFHEIFVKLMLALDEYIEAFVGFGGNFFYS